LAEQFSEKRRHLLWLIAFGGLSRNLERLYAVCVCCKTLTPKERDICHNRFARIVGVLLVKV